VCSQIGWHYLMACVKPVHWSWSVLYRTVSLRNWYFRFITDRIVHMRLVAGIEARNGEMALYT